MKVALVHDYIKEYGGAERVLEELHKLYPEAPIYTSIYAPIFLGPHENDFKNMKIKTSFLNLIPFREKLISPLRLLAPLAFMSFDLSKYEVIIVSQTGAYFPNFVEKGKAKLICYTHTPPRYLYGYMTAREINNGFVKFISSIVFHFLRLADFESSKNVDFFIANSEEIKARIEKFYRRDAIVINPPVDIPSDVRKANSDKRSYYVAGGRLARAKGIDIIVEGFNKNGKKLKVFGKGFAGFDEELKAAAGKNIEFVGEITDMERQELVAGAKAYVFASFDEDFGITPVEAQALGTPVIAYKSGGVKETVVDGKTGIFFDENTPEALIKAIEKFESASWRTKISPEACHKNAQKFSSEVFDKKMTNFVSKMSSRT